MLPLKITLFVILLKFGYIEGQCSDTLSTDNPITMKDSKGKPFKLTDCAKLVMMFPGACEKKTVGGNKGVCCETCPEDTKCLDKVSKNVPLNLSGKEITSCAEIVGKYKVLCKKHGKKRGACCMSCKSVDTKCTDKLITFKVGNKELSCSEYVAEDPCRCADKKTKKNCCESCKNTDIGSLECDCRDTVSKTNPVPIKIKDKNTDEIVVDIEVTSCNDVVNYYANFCQKGMYGGNGEPCCKSCTGVDTKCTDLSLWEGTVENGNMKCENCTCHEIMKKSKALMKKACTDNITGTNSALTAKLACCLQCKRAGVV